MAHIKLEIIANEYLQEELIALLDDFNPSGFEQTDENLVVYFSEPDFAEQSVIELLEGYSCTKSIVEDRNWNEEWEQNFQPVVVENFVAVRAHFHQPVISVEHEIVITPKMSFGTGHHATTYMMMAQMRQIDFQNKTVFDFGTGTGILAILAEKLGAASVDAIDIDEWSIANTTENVERNGCRKIDAQLSPQIPSKAFDVILANINRNVIIDYATTLSEAIVDGGHVLFSGLLVADEADIHSVAEAQDLRLTRRMERQGWLSLLFVKVRSR